MYKGFIISWIDNDDTGVLKAINNAPKELPTVFTFNDLDGTPMFCCGGREMNADGIRLWGQDVILLQRKGPKLAGENRDAAI